MDATNFLTGAIGMIAVGAGFLAEAVTGNADAASFFGIPLASFASSGATVVAMALALRYMADKQSKNEDALREAYKSQIDMLSKLLLEEKQKNDKELSLLQSMSHHGKVPQ